MKDHERTCKRCGQQNLLVVIKNEFTNDEWYCYPCSIAEKDAKKYKGMKVYCEVCNKEFTSYVSKGPYKCGVCKYKESPELMSIPRALKAYKESILDKENNSDSKYLNAPRAFKYVRRYCDFDDTYPVVKIIRLLADMMGVRISEITRRLGNRELTEEALDLILKVHFENAFRGIEARMLDQQLLDQGGKGCHYVTYCRDIDGAFCHVTDDPSEIVPF